jgi:hypothetical protein
MSKSLLKKIIVAAKKVPQLVTLPKSDSISVKREEPWKAATGPQSYLATVNQPSGAHIPLKNKEKTRQDLKKKLRKDWDSL